MGKAFELAQLARKTNVNDNTGVVTINGLEVGSGNVNLDDLSVSVNSAGVNNLSYNNLTGVFSFTPTDLSNYATLDDVPTSLLDLGIDDGTNGQVLTTNGAGTFTFTTVSGGGNVVENLDDILDVVITSATAGQFLKYNGSNWINSSDTLGLSITDITYPNGHYFVLTSGNETVTLTGTGFQSMCNVYINGSPVTSVSYINSYTVEFVTPVMLNPGTYSLSLVNPNSGTAYWSPGILFVDAGAPVFVDPPGLLETFSRNLSATTTLEVVGGTPPYTFSITSGALPSGLTLNASTGVISGIAPNVASNTVYNFTARVEDSLTESSSSNFIIAVDVPVNWSVPVSTFSIISNNQFMIQLEEDITNVPVFTLDTFSIISNNDFAIELEEDTTTTPEFTLEAFSVISNNQFMIELEEDTTTTPAFTLEAFSVRSNADYFTTLEEDTTTTPEFTFETFTVRSNLDYFIEFEEDFTNDPTFTLGQFNIKSINV